MGYGNNILKKQLEHQLERSIEDSIIFSDIGRADYYGTSNMLSYLDTEAFIKKEKNNPNIVTILTTEELYKKLEPTNIKPIICEDPTFHFYTLFNYANKLKVTREASTIDPSAIIHESAQVSKYNVVIKKM